MKDIDFLSYADKKAPYSIVDDINQVVSDLDSAALSLLKLFSYK